MKFTSLGRTGLKVSRVCLGTMNFGNATEEKESFAIMDRALELGINFFDTANRYGKPVGRTEEIIGRWLSQGGRRREQIVLATKVFGPMGPGANDEDLSVYHIRMACNDSLKRLQTDHVDLYQMHHVSRGLPHPKSQMEYLKGDLSNLVYPPHIKPGVPWEEIWQQMEQLVQSGKILYVGSSNFAAWNIAQANERAASRHFLGLVSEQSLYNLSQRMLELEMVPVCREYGLGILPWSPLAAGRLAGAVEKATQGRRALVTLTEKERSQIEAYEAFCRELGESPAIVALAWLLHNPVVTAPIIGPRTMEQLESAVQAIEISLSDDVLAKLDEIWPGPGNQAPEAYAW